jgi:lysophospholipase L1-like esterase
MTFSSRRPSLGVRITAVVLAAIVSLALLEAGLRLFGFHATPVDIQAGRTRDARAFHLFEDDNFEYHPELIWAPRKNHSVFNAQGFRGEEIHGPKQAGEVRIFAVGDSNTLGWAGTNGAHWPRNLEVLARQDVPGITVVNAGVWGYASFQGVRRFRQTLEYDPDIVLVSFGSNDAHLVLEPDKDYKARSFRYSATGQWLQNFRLGELLLSAIDGAGGGGSTLVPRVSLDDFRENLRTIATEARAHDVNVVLLTRPYVGGVPNDGWWKHRGADYSVAAAEVAAAEHLAFVDVYSFFKERGELFADESHFTDEGHLQAAVLIWEHIKAIVERKKQ